MRLGILTPKPKQSTLEVWALAGLKAFRGSDHTRGFKPAQIQVNPQDNGFPHDLKIEGLPVVCNPEVKAGYLRVCTEDLGEDI